MSEVVAEGIVEARLLREYLSVFTSIVDEGRIHFNDDGLEARCVDSSRAAMVNPATLGTSAFESYSSPGAVTVGVNFEGMVDRLKPADKGELVHLSVDMETRRLGIEYGKADQTMAMIDPDAIKQGPDDPDLDHANTATVEAADLSEAIDMADLVSTYVYVRADPDERAVTVYAEGDVDDVTYTFDSDALIDARLTEATESLFSRQYFENMADPMPDDAEVTLHFDEEYPVKMNWSGTDGHMDVQQVLAPRIQNR